MQAELSRSLAQAHKALSRSLCTLPSARRRQLGSVRQTSATATTRQRLPLHSGFICMKQRSFILLLIVGFFASAEPLCAAVVTVAAAAQLLAMFTLLSTTHTNTRDSALPLIALSLSLTVSSWFSFVTRLT